MTWRVPDWRGGFWEHFESYRECWRSYGILAFFHVFGVPKTEGGGKPKQRCPLGFTTRELSIPWRPLGPIPHQKWTFSFSTSRCDPGVKLACYPPPPHPYSPTQLHLCLPVSRGQTNWEIRSAPDTYYPGLRTTATQDWNRGQTLKCLQEPNSSDSGTELGRWCSFTRLRHFTIVLLMLCASWNKPYWHFSSFFFPSSSVRFSFPYTSFLYSSYEFFIWWHLTLYPFNRHTLCIKHYRTILHFCREICMLPCLPKHISLLAPFTFPHLLETWLQDIFHFYAILL